jgi:hypothetical protein
MDNVPPVQQCDNNFFKNCKTFSWHKWLMPVIPVTQEAEIRRIAVGSQQDPISKKFNTR